LTKINDKTSIINDFVEEKLNSVLGEAKDLLKDLTSTLPNFNGDLVNITSDPNIFSLNEKELIYLDKKTNKFDLQSSIAPTSDVSITFKVNQKEVESANKVMKDLANKLHAQAVKARKRKSYKKK